MQVNERVAEVNSFLDHSDFDLAIRRMLDLAWETQDLSMVKTAVSWAKSARDSLKSDSLVDVATAKVFLEKLRAVHIPFSGGVLISTENVEKKYAKGNFSLKPLSLTLNLGEIIGVVGENGNGKTTFLRILAGELAISAGNIHFHLLDNQKPDPYTIRQNVSFVPQRIPRWHGYLKDNLHFSASISGLKGEENETMVDFMLERLDLSRYANHTWDQISSGYKTRFEIARVLLQRPKLLILDEPLANLDINAQQTLLSDLRYIAKSQFRPMGVVLSSQQLFEVEKMADTVLFLKNGECLIESKEAKNEGKYLSILELETVFDREKLSSIFDSETVISFNGGYFTLKSSTADAQQILGKLVSNHVPITYLRDITLSTKRFF